MTLLALKLATAHLITAFLICPDAWVQARISRTRRSRVLVHLKSTGAFIVLASLLALPNSRIGPLESWQVLAVLAAVAIARVAVEMLGSLRTCRSWYGFTLIHTIHVCTVVAILSVFGTIPGLSARLLSMWISPRTYLLVGAYLFSVGFGSVLVPLVTAPMRDRTTDSAPSGMKDAGRYVGILERILVTTLIVFWPKLDASAIGLLFSAKSIARFPEFKKQHFAEYYLIGTLTSFMVAIAAGLVVRCF